jgi:hypothetical protein
VECPYADGVDLLFGLWETLPVLSTASLTPLTVQLNSSQKRRRFRSQLAGQIARNKRQFDDFNISPVCRQTLQHWGYVLTKADFDAYCKAKGFK